jgi:hypothetical protein
VGRLFFFFSKMFDSPPNSRRQKADMKQFPYRGPTILGRPVNHTVTWRFVLGACELIHMFVCKEKAAVIMLKILGILALLPVIVQ